MIFPYSTFFSSHHPFSFKIGGFWLVILILCALFAQQAERIETWESCPLLFHCILLMSITNTTTQTAITDFVMTEHCIRVQRKATYWPKRWWCTIIIGVEYAFSHESFMCILFWVSFWTFDGHEIRYQFPVTSRKKMKRFGFWPNHLSNATSIAAFPDAVSLNEPANDCRLAMESSRQSGMRKSRRTERTSGPW